MSDSLEQASRTNPGPCFGGACNHVSHRPPASQLDLTEPMTLLYEARRLRRAAAGEVSWLAWFERAEAWIDQFEASL